MKKESKISVGRIPSFVFYAIAAICAIGIFTAGRHCLFVGAFWYILGLSVDPNFSNKSK